jgi:hypothetical protein
MTMSLSSEQPKHSAVVGRAEDDEDGMVAGLGSGSAASFAIGSLGAAAVVAGMNALSRSEPEPPPFAFRDGALGFYVNLPPLSVATVTFGFAARDRG